MSFVLDYKDFSYYDVLLKKWHVDKGIYKIQICKNADEVILSSDVERKENDKGFVEHQKTAYNLGEWKVTESDFASIMKTTLPPKSTIRKKPYSLNSIAEDFKTSFWGRVLYKQIIRMALAMLPKNASKSEKEYYITGATQMPLRGIVAIGDAGISLVNAEGMVDFANGRVIRGLIKIMKKEK